MFVFHQHIIFLTFLVCIWLWQHCCPHVCLPVPVALCQVLVTLCRHDLREMFFHTCAVSFHNRDLFPVKAGVFNWEFG